MGGADGILFCKGRCKPTMMSSPPYYKCFAVFSGIPTIQEIKGALCQYKAGQSQSCKHVAALLIMYSYLSEPACTSEECSWICPACRQSSSSHQCSEDIDLGGVRKRAKWDGPVADIIDLEKALEEKGLEAFLVIV